MTGNEGTRMGNDNQHKAIDVHKLSTVGSLTHDQQDTRLLTVSVEQKAFQHDGNSIIIITHT